jgi:hypothetical protein
MSVRCDEFGPVIDDIDVPPGRRHGAGTPLGSRTSGACWWPPMQAKRRRRRLASGESCISPCPNARCCGDAVGRDVRPVRTALAVANGDCFAIARERSVVDQWKGEGSAFTQPLRRRRQAPPSSRPAGQRSTPPARSTHPAPRAPRRLAALCHPPRLRPFVRLARTLRQHRDGILAAIHFGISNGRHESLNIKVSLISHRSCTGIVIDLPR